MIVLDLARVGTGRRTGPSTHRPPQSGFTERAAVRRRWSARHPGSGASSKRRMRWRPRRLGVARWTACPDMTLGWDIGGVNTKVARVAGDRVPRRSLVAVRVAARPGCARAGAADARDRGGRQFGRRACRDDDRGAVADVPHQARRRALRARRGRGRVSLGRRSACTRWTAGSSRPAEAAREPLAVAAANWAATARLVVAPHPDALLVDIGTTTTDIIPIVGGDVAATGWTDPDRLASGELVYTGRVRTPAEAIASTCRSASGRSRGVRRRVRAGRRRARLARRSRAGRLHRAHARWPARRRASSPASGLRACDLRRSGACWTTRASRRSPMRWPPRRSRGLPRRSRGCARVIRCSDTAVVTGLGDFIGRPRGACRRGCRWFRSRPSSVRPPRAARRPRRLRCCSTTAACRRWRPGRAWRTSRCVRVVQTVVKIGGGLLAHDGCLDAVLAVIGEWRASGGC